MSPFIERQSLWLAFFPLPSVCGLYFESSNSIESDICHNYIMHIFLFVVDGHHLASMLKRNYNSKPYCSHFWLPLLSQPPFQRNTTVIFLFRAVGYPRCRHVEVVLGWLTYQTRVPSRRCSLAIAQSFRKCGLSMH